MGFWSRLKAAMKPPAVPAQAYPWPVNYHGSITPLGRLQCRLRLGVFADPSQNPYSEDPAPYDHLDAVETKDEVIVFVVKNGKPVTIHDKRELFPSDVLVVQLKLLGV